MVLQELFRLKVFFKIFSMYSNRTDKLLKLGILLFPIVAISILNGVAFYRLEKDIYESLSAVFITLIVAGFGVVVFLLIQFYYIIAFKSGEVKMSHKNEKLIGVFVLILLIFSWLGYQDAKHMNRLENCLSNCKGKEKIEECLFGNYSVIEEDE